jgi:O-antigen ligase
VKKIGKSVFPELVPWVIIMTSLLLALIGGAIVVLLVLIPWAMTHPVEFWYYFKGLRTDSSVEWQFLGWE